MSEVVVSMNKKYKVVKLESLPIVKHEQYSTFQIANAKALIEKYSLPYSLATVLQVWTDYNEIYFDNQLVWLDDNKERVEHASAKSSTSYSSATITRG